MFFIQDFLLQMLEIQMYFLTHSAGSGFKSWVMILLTCGVPAFLSRRVDKFKPLFYIIERMKNDYVVNKFIINDNNQLIWQKYNTWDMITIVIISIIRK